MILKIRNSTGWTLVDNLEQVTIHEDRYTIPAATEMHPELLVLGPYLGEKEGENPTTKVAMVHCIKAGQPWRIGFSTTAFLMNDNGDTVEHIDARHGNLVDRVLGEEDPSRVSVGDIEPAPSSGKEYLGNLKKSVEDLKIHGYEEFTPDFSMLYEGLVKSLEVILPEFNVTASDLSDLAVEKSDDQPYRAARVVLGALAWNE